MEKLYVKDAGGKKDLIMCLSHDSSNGYIVAVGEKLDERSERFVHFKVEDFLKYARDVEWMVRTAEGKNMCMGCKNWFKTSELTKESDGELYCEACLC